MEMLPTQRALWKLRCTLRDPTVLNLAFGLLLDGPFDRMAMEWVLRELVRRHQPLRTAYSGPADCPAVEVASDPDIQLEYEDASATADGRHIGELHDHFHKAMR